MQEEKENETDRKGTETYHKKTGDRDVHILYKKVPITGGKIMTDDDDSKWRRKPQSKREAGRYGDLHKTRLYDGKKIMNQDLRTSAVESGLIPPQTLNTTKKKSW